ncbi:hypothetical protein CRG98_023995 [Punica granatum]|uniref:Reverse transcriptase Ty1/copia-type domain-containing protein n=1 Tax=Punica granatum TaxID=22663 RepID=A0A2I0JH77_PUNGR|nr:hypothetical protein CRG98_023995 [Punica granatum]
MAKERRGKAGAARGRTRLVKGRRETLDSTLIRCRVEEEKLSGRTVPTPENPDRFAGSIVPAEDIVGSEVVPVSQNTHKMTTRSKDGTLPPPCFMISYHPFVITMSAELREPQSFAQARKHSAWRATMKEEYTTLLQNNTWDLVPPSPAYNVVGCKWVYHIKQKADDTIDRYKAQLVATRFNQREWVYYSEMFSPVIKSITIWTILSIVVSSHWFIRQLDVKNVFLHDYLNEEVYIAQPPTFVDPSRPDHVCILCCSLYGLKQAPRAWFQRLSTYLQRLGFSDSKADSSLFILRGPQNIVYLLVYVDDIILTGTPEAPFQSIITAL